MDTLIRVKNTAAEQRAIGALLVAIGNSVYGCIPRADWERIARLPATRNNLRRKGLVTTFVTHKPDPVLWVTLTDEGVRVASKVTK